MTWWNRVKRRICCSRPTEGQIEAAYALNRARDDAERVTSLWDDVTKVAKKVDDTSDHLDRVYEKNGFSDKMKAAMRERRT